MPLVDPRARPLPPPHSALSPEAVVEWLMPVLSDERKARIERVLRHRLASVTVVLENPRDPHNGAAVIRTCEALGLLHVHVVEEAQPFSCSRRVSQNAHKWINVYRHAEIDDGLSFLEEAGFACWAAVPPSRGSPTRSPPGIDCTRPVALVFGNEHRGLSRRALARCSGRFSIPMRGFSESLNLSVCAAMALGEVTARRRALLGRAGDLPPAALMQLRAAYYCLSSPHAVSLALQRAQVQEIPR